MVWLIVAVLNRYIAICTLLQVLHMAKEPILLEMPPILINIHHPTHKGRSECISSEFLQENIFEVQIP